MTYPVSRSTKLYSSFKVVKTCTIVLKKRFMSLNQPSKTESSTYTPIYYRLMIFPVLSNLQCITLIFLHVFWYSQVWGSSSDSVWKTSGKNCAKFLYVHFGSMHYTLIRVAFIQPKIPEISVGMSNRTDHFSLDWPEYSVPALKVVHFDLVSLFWLVRLKCPFQFNKIGYSPVPLFCILLTRTITKHAVAWVGSVQPECTVWLGMWNFRNFRTGIFVDWKAPKVYGQLCLNKHTYKMATFSPLFDSL